METFKLNTVKSLYAPFEVEIDGKVYKSIKLTHAVKLELNKLEAEIAKNSFKAVYEWVSFMLDIEKAVLDKLDVREVEDIQLFVSRQLRESEIERRNKELNALEKQVKRMSGNKEPDTPKNVPRPGKTKLS